MIVKALKGFQHLFFRKKFGSHRIIGLFFLVQYVSSVYLFIFNYQKWLKSPLLWTCPLTGFCQSINAAFTFTFLPKTQVPGFAAVADKSVLSYFTVVENSFYAMQLLFVTVYLHDDYREKIQKLVVVEPFFVFFVFWARDLWPSSRISKALDSSDKTMTPLNRFILTCSAYAIKAFYLFAKHFVGFFPLYLIYLNRLTEEDQHLLYAVQVLSGYAATISIFIHTLKFKQYIGPITAMVAYDVIIPGFLILYYQMTLVILRNADLALLCGGGLLMNLLPKPAFHIYQGCVFVAFSMGHFSQIPLFPPASYEMGACFALSLIACALLIMWLNPRSRTKDLKPTVYSGVSENLKNEGVQEKMLKSSEEGTALKSDADDEELKNMNS